MCSTATLRRGRRALFGAMLAAALGISTSAKAGENAGIVITTTKPFGPVVGQFSTAGAFVDAGSLVTERRTNSALPAPWGVVTHLVLRFEGGWGTFTIRADFKEQVTSDPQVFTGSGTWVVIDGTAAYATLRGSGNLASTADDRQNLITRIFTGLVHFN